MGRWIRNTIMFLSLAVLIAGSVFWVRSIWYAESVTLDTRGTFYFLTSTDQRVVIGWVTEPGKDDAENADRNWQWDTRQEKATSLDTFRTRLTGEATTHTEVLGLEIFNRKATRRSGAVTYVAVPYWFIAPLSAVLLFWLSARAYRKSETYRRTHGLCLGCGFDLQGRTGTCPWCGRIPEPTE